jgi:hypothetical protein
MKKILILLSLLLVFPLAYADDDDSSSENGVIRIKMKLTGVLRHVDDFGRTIFDVDSKGKPGKATGRGVAISGPPVMFDALPDDNKCMDFTPAPSGMHLMEAQIVMTFRDGSMIWGNSPPDGYVCFSGYAYAPYDIMGGTGRYEEATGWIDVELDTYAILPPPLPNLVIPETGIAKGEIVLP